MGPSPSICSVSRSLGPLSMSAIIRAPDMARPRAAVAMGLVLCACLAVSVRSREVMANALIWASAATARIIVSL